MDRLLPTRTGRGNVSTARFHAFSAMPRASVAALAAIAVLLLPLGSTAVAVTPDSPEVRRLIDKGMKYLKEADHGRVGGKCLIGMCFLKEGHPHEHPKIEAAVTSIQNSIRGEVRTISLPIYDAGIALIFLCDLDPSKYQAEIQKLLAYIEYRQKNHGGWGYFDGSHGETGDTSMVQYAVLGSWTAHRSGAAKVSLESMENVCNWLLRTQDPSGGWGYQGVDSGSNDGRRVEQNPVRESLSAAGLGSTYICADLLGFSRMADAIEEEEGVPSVFRPVKDVDAAGQQQGPLTKRVDGRILQRAISDGNRWFSGKRTYEGTDWTHYYMYGRERYESFRELVEQRAEKEPAWYNEGVRFLSRTQKADGSWKSNDQTADTAFAILFLLRSTKKTIEKTSVDLAAGELIGGRGLPSDVTNLRVVRGRVVSRPLGGDAAALMQELESAKPADVHELLLWADSIEFSSNPEQRAAQAARLRRMVSAEKYESRVVAVRALARMRDLDQVPTLIYALSDPDWRVVKEAREGLEFVSRKFEGFGPADQAGDDEKRAAIERWKEWYRGIRPDAEFLD